MSRLKADLLILLCAGVWGCGFYFQKGAMDHIGALTFVAARTALAAAALAPLALLEHRRSGGPAPPQLMLISVAGGVTFFLGAWLQQEGLRTATVTNTGFLTALYVIFTPVAAWMVYATWPGPMVLPAIALSFAGTWLLGGATLEGFSAGDLLVAVSALFWALHVLVTGRASRLHRPLAFTCLQFVLVAVLAACGALYADTPTLEGLKASGVAILYIGLLSGALTFTILTHAMRATPPAEAAILASTESLFAAVVGASLLGERLSVVSWSGAALILAAIVLVQVAPLTRWPWRDYAPARDRPPYRGP